MNSCGAFCSYCGKCGRKIDERLVRNKPANVSPPGVALHGSQQAGAGEGKGCPSQGGREEGSHAVLPVE